MANVARALSSLVREKAWCLSATHLSGSLNTEADRLSRIKTEHDWFLDQAVFDTLVASLCRQGAHPPTIDLMANRENAKLPRFFSRFRDPRAAGLDCWTHDWTSEVGFWNGPYSLLPRVLRKNRNFLWLIAPVFRRAPWWTELSKAALLSVPVPRRAWLPGPSGLTPLPLKGLWQSRLFFLKPTAIRHLGPAERRKTTTGR